MKSQIQLIVFLAGEERIVNTYFGEYRNVMELLQERFDLEEFGECGGMGRCSSCVTITSGVRGDLKERNRNEPVTLNMHGFIHSKYRLSCQLLNTKDLDGATIEILDPV